MPDNFIPSAEFEDCYFDTRNGISAIAEGKNPRPGLRYFVRVGGGYRGFKTIGEARDYYGAD